MRRAIPESSSLAAFVSPSTGLWSLAVAGERGADVAIGDISEDGTGALNILAVPGAGSAEEALRAPLLGAVALEDVDEPLAATSDDAGLVLRNLSGSVTRPGAREAALSGGGLVSPHTPPNIGSARLVLAWFEQAAGVGLLAFRPSGSTDQERDEVYVRVLATSAVQAAEAETVFDPRLSITSRDDGTLRRLGIELWLGVSEEGEQRPYRVAAEPLSPPARITTGECVVAAHPIRCHGHAGDGVGIFAALGPS